MSGVFGGQSNSGTAEIYTGISVSTSMYGACIPYIAGRQRVPFNLLWYGNFTATGAGDGGGKGGGGGGTSSYTYNTAFIAALCIGPIQGVFQVWHDKSLETLTSENLALALGSSGQPIWSYLTTYAPGGASFSGYISGTALTVTAVTSGQITQGQAISSGAAAGTVITGVGAAGGGVGGGYTVSVPQTVGSPAVPANFVTSMGATGSQAVPYDHIAYVATSNYNLGSSANMPNLNFEVEGVVPGYADAYGVYDADPSAVVTDYLTDPVHGALAGPGGAAITIGAASAPLTGHTNSYQAYCMALGLLTSPYEDTQRQASDFISELMQCTNSDVVLSFGTLKVIPYADATVSGTTPDGITWTYSPNLTPIFSFKDSDYCPKEGEPPVKLTRKALADTHNIVNIEYLDRLNYYNACPASASDLSDIAKFGPRVMNTITLHQITSATVAKTVAQLILQADLYERNTYEWRARADYSLLEPMDYVALTDAALGLNNNVVRITDVEDDGTDFVTFKAMLVPGVVRNTPQYNWQQGQGIFLNYNAQPGSVLTPVIFTMPPLPAGKVGGITLGAAVCGPSTSGTWGGCNVYMSSDGGTTYSLVGSITSPAKYGQLNASLPLAADPDTADTLGVTLSNTALQLSTAVTHADADADTTLAIVDVGTANAEVLSYGSAALIGAGIYNLTYLRRGQYGSVPALHPIGAAFVKLDGYIFTLTIDSGMAGQLLFFKFASFNSFGRAIQSLSSCVAYSYQLPNGANPTLDATLVPRGSCSVVGQTVYKSMQGATAWDSDCVSSQAVSSGAQALARYGAGLNWAVGLVSSVPVLPATLNPGTNMDFCWFSNGGVQWTIYENGALIGEFSPPASGDILQVIYDGFFVHYYLNGLLCHTSIGASGNIYYLGLAMYDPGDTAGGVDLTALAAATPSQFIGVGLAIVNNTHVMKQGGVAAWDSCAYSISGYTNCHVTAKWNTLLGRVMVGLSAQPSASASYANANYAIDNNAGQYLIYESGTLELTLTQVPSLTDVVTVTYDGNTITYLINGSVQRTVTAPGKVLFGFCPILDPSAGLNSLEFGPTTIPGVQDTSQLGVSAATTLYTSFLAGPYAATQSTIGQTILTTGMSLPLASDANQNWVVTCTLEAMDNETTDYGGQCQLQLYMDTHNLLVNADVFAYGQLANLSTGRKPMTLQAIFPAASINSPVSVSVGIAANFTTTNSRTVTGWQLTFQAELVKR